MAEERSSSSTIKSRLDFIKYRIAFNYWSLERAPKNGERLCAMRELADDEAGQGKKAEDCQDNSALRDST